MVISLLDRSQGGWLLALGCSLFFPGPMFFVVSISYWALPSLPPSFPPLFVSLSTTISSLGCCWFVFCGSGDAPSFRPPGFAFVPSAFPHLPRVPFFLHWPSRCFPLAPFHDLLVCLLRRRLLHSRAFVPLTLYCTEARCAYAQICHTGCAPFFGLLVPHLLFFCLLLVRQPIAPCPPRPPPGAQSSMLCASSSHIACSAHCPLTASYPGDPALHHIPSSGPFG